MSTVGSASLFKALGPTLIVSRVDLMLKRVNTAALEIFGYTTEAELIKSTVNVLIPGSYFHGEELLKSPIIAGDRVCCGQSSGGYVEGLTRNGDVVDLLIRVSVMKDQFVVSLMDAGALLDLADVASNEKEKLRESELKRFLAEVIVDVSGPVQAMVRLIDSAAAVPSDDAEDKQQKQRQVLQKCRQSAFIVLQLLHDLRPSTSRRSLSVDSGTSIVQSERSSDEQTASAAAAAAGSESTIQDHTDQGAQLLRKHSSVLPRPRQRGKKNEPSSSVAAKEKVEASLAEKEIAAAIRSASMGQPTLSFAQLKSLRSLEDALVTSSTDSSPSPEATGTSQASSKPKRKKKSGAAAKRRGAGSPTKIETSAPKLKVPPPPGDIPRSVTLAPNTGLLNLLLTGTLTYSQFQPIMDDYEKYVNENIELMDHAFETKRASMLTESANRLLLVTIPFGDAAKGDVCILKKVASQARDQIFDEALKREFKSECKRLSKALWAKKPFRYPGTWC